MSNQEYSGTKNRVYALYRVSTLGQVEKDDIPMQKTKCRAFAEEKGWMIVKEFAEKGVSGYKVAAKDRDAIQEIQKAAVAGKFDILLVFMFDRLGRREDETRAGEGGHQKAVEPGRTDRDHFEERDRRGDRDADDGSEEDRADRHHGVLEVEGEKARDLDAEHENHEVRERGKQRRGDRSANVFVGCGNAPLGGRGVGLRGLFGDGPLVLIQIVFHCMIRLSPAVQVITVRQDLSSANCSFCLEKEKNPQSKRTSGVTLAESFIIRTLTVGAGISPGSAGRDPRSQTILPVWNYTKPQRFCYERRILSGSESTGK